MNGRPPGSPAERAVLGAILLDNRAFTRVGLTPHDFAPGPNRAIFAVMVSLAESGQPIDPITISMGLEQNGTLDDAGGLDYLVTLDQTAATAVNIEHHAAFVRDAAAARRLDDLAAQMRRQAAAATGAAAGGNIDRAGVDAIIAAARAGLDAIASGRTVDGGLTPVAALVDGGMERMEARGRDEAPREGKRLGCGLLDVETILRGHPPGHVRVLAARPAVGKTAALLQHVVAYAGAGVGDVLVFSLEAPAAEFADRLLVQEARCDAGRFQDGAVTADERKRLGDAAYRLQRLPIFISGDSAATVERIDAAVRGWPRRVAAVAVDYLGLVRSEGRYGRRHEEIGAISRAFKRLSTLGGDSRPETHTRVLLAAQLNREGDKRGGADRRPRLSDLRESGDIEQDASQVVFLHREAVTDPSADPTLAEWIVGKNRVGPTGAVKLRWLGQFGRFDAAVREWHQQAMP